MMIKIVFPLSLIAVCNFINGQVVETNKGYIKLNSYEKLENSSISDPKLEEDLNKYEINLNSLSYDQLLSQPKLDSSPYVRIADEIIVYCYPFNDEEINNKCYDALVANNASSLFLPLMNEMQMEKNEEYYQKLKELKRKKLKSKKNIKIYGVAYDKPDWSIIKKLVGKFSGLFSGVLLEWVGTNACIWNIDPIKKTEIDEIRASSGEIMYFFRHQNCEEDLLYDLTKGAYYNPNPRISYQEEDLKVEKGKFPHFIKPVFSCFHGEEGRCYQAHKNKKDVVCNENQLYAWSPLDPLGGLIIFYRNDTCLGLHNHVLYSVV